MTSVKQTTKRSYGSGSIDERSPGVFLIRWRDNAGKRHNDTVKGNRKNAEAELTKQRISMETGSFSGKKKLTVGAYLQNWIETYATTNCTAKTVQGYRQSINCYTEPIAGITLQKLDATHIQPIYAGMIKRGLSNRTVDALHKTLNIALNTAVKQGTLKRNILDSVIAPKVVKKEIEVWDAETRAKAMTVLRESQYGDFYQLGLMTGMRRGELAGLKWANVNLANQQLQVVNTLQRITGQGLLNGQPKTERSRRSIALSPDTVALLHEIRGRQITQQLEVSDAWTDSGYVFTDASGMPVDPNLATRAFKKVVATAGLPKLTIHGLRHTHATILMEQGVNPKVVSERLGHASPATTMDIYSHVLPDMQEKAALAIDAALAPK
jgi:integrase